MLENILLGFIYAPLNLYLLFMCYQLCGVIRIMVFHRIIYFIAAINHYSGFATFLGVVVAMITGFVGWRSGHVAFKQSVDQRLFYEIKEGFSDSIRILQEVLSSDFKNDYIQWHNALNELKSVQSLSNMLTVKVYQDMYINLCHRKQFDLYKLLFQIDDYRFFYGCDNYTKRGDNELFRESFPEIKEVDVSTPNRTNYYV